MDAPAGRVKFRSRRGARARAQDEHVAIASSDDRRERRADVGIDREFVAFRTGIR
jgi:hypothetical protein